MMESRLPSARSNPAAFPLWEDFFPSLGALAQRGSMPSMNVKETKDEFVIEAEVPGYTPDQIDVSVTGNIVAIRGTREETRKEEGVAYHLRERTLGQFARTFELPDDVDAEKVTADYEKGVLTVRLAKSEATKPRKVAIKAVGK